MNHRARQRPARLAWAAGFVVLALLGGFLAYLDAARVSDDELARGTVKLTVYLRGGKVGTGSGTIVDAGRGLILTNAHVVAPRAPGLAVNSATLPDDLPPAARRIIVSVSPGDGETARPRFRASVVATDGYLDLAVVRITQTTAAAKAGAKAGAGDLAELGELTQLEPAAADADQRAGTDLRVIGYPADTRSHPSSTTRGNVSGATPDPRLRTRRAYVNTDSRVDAGGSGGPGVDDAGRIVGVTTLGRAADASAGTDAEEGSPVVLRPIGLALPLIAAARQGKTYSSPWTAPAPVTATVGAVRLVTAGEAPVVLGCTRGTQSSGKLSVGLSYKGFGPAGGHTDLMATLYSSAGGRLAPVASAGTLPNFPTTLPAAGCLTLTLAGDDGAPLPAGRYLLRVGLGASLTRIASARFDLP